MEKVIEIKTCKHCSSQFEITDKDMEFYEKVSPSFGGKKYLIPSPTLCPDCRQQRRLSFRNERHLYKRTCDATGKPMVSIYSPDKPYTVYEQDFWWSDAWDAGKYEQDFDFSRNFFEQFSLLVQRVPIIGLNSTTNENSEYVNLSGYNNDCYLVFAGEYNQRCLYSSRIIECSNCIDNIEITKSDNCYSNINIENCYNLNFSQNCKDCHSSYFLFSCIGCHECLFCTNLTNKSYCIFNSQYSRDEYETIKDTLIGDISNGKKKSFEDFNTLKIKNSIHKGENLINCENCIGDNIVESKNVNYSFDCTEMEDSKYIYSASKGKELLDVSNTTEQEISYEGLSVGYKSYKVLFTNGGWTCDDIFYCFHCHNSQNLFGCVGLRNKSYCILNKQYTKEEYETLVPKIIEHMQQTGEWGEFFPSNMSPFGYNETVAMEYYPVQCPHSISPEGREETTEGMIHGIIQHHQFIPLPMGEARGGQEMIFNWSTYESPPPKVDKIIPADKLPQNIEDIPDDILTRAIECEVTKKPFRIIQQELEFYRKHQLPIPRRHPDQRHLDRMALRNPRKLYERTCDKCGIEMQTTYSPERPEIVYCQTCYEKEVY